MPQDLKKIIFQAEEDYLPEADLDEFKTKVNSLAERLAIYEIIREQEIALFQPIADQLVQNSTERQPKVIEKAIKHWIAILRYCAMAMLLNNTEYLQHRLLEWLTEQIQAHELQSLETEIYKLLQIRLKKVISAEQLVLLNPFLEEARKTLLVSTPSLN
jgi:Phycobilisome protein